jgi:GDPmannose 4,6-dehydratase
MAAKRALVTGIAGQDGSYLAELLVSERYEVHGVVRPGSSGQFENLAAIRDRVELHEIDLLDEDAVIEVLSSVRPHEVYNLASPSFVPRSWHDPVGTSEFAAVGVTLLLETIRRVDDSIRVCQAASSEIFGRPRESPQSEETPLAPVTPYGAAKAYGHFIVGSFRARYGLHATSAILYNHESPRRPVDFAPRKIARAAAASSLGLEREVELGSLDAARDWGYAVDYVRAMWLALQEAEPHDYVVATGETHTVRELAQIAFAYVGLDWQEHVRVDESLIRGSAELRDLVGDSTRARARLGWAPSVDFAALVRLLVDADLERLRAGLEVAESVVEG